MVMVNIRRKRIRYRGLASVEAAIVFPLLLLLSLGVIKYGWMFLKVQQITNAARVGARIAIRPDATIEDHILPAIDALMTSAGMGDSGYQVTISPSSLDGLSVGDPIDVTITVLFANVDIMDVPLFPQGGNLGASVTMAREGFWASGT
jgi:hypothetical protein